jgi:hypothetical protein
MALVVGASSQCADDVAHGVGGYVGEQDAHALEPVSGTALVNVPKDAHLSDTDAKAAVMAKASWW